MRPATISAGAIGTERGVPEAGGFGQRSEAEICLDRGVRPALRCRGGQRPRHRGPGTCARAGFYAGTPAFAKVAVLARRGGGTPSQNPQNNPRPICEQNQLRGGQCSEAATADQTQRRGAKRQYQCPEVGCAHGGIREIPAGRRSLRADDESGNGAPSHHAAAPTDSYRVQDHHTRTLLRPHALWFSRPCGTCRRSWAVGRRWWWAG